MNPVTRQEKLRRLVQTKSFSVVIIGAGINGAGVYRDCALQGLNVLLIDKSDFCSGASSAPSRMIHGGLRYLENGEFSLVKESLKERNLLLQNAPHYVKPLVTTIPLFYKFSGILNAVKTFLGFNAKPSARGSYVVKLGLLLYDFFTLKNQTLPKHTFDSDKKSKEKWPQLNKNIVCTATYHDAWVSYPERLCLEVIEDVESNENAIAINYLEFVKSAEESIVLRDLINDVDIEVSTKIVINASGPWIDFSNRKMNFESNLIGGTKGSHLVINNAELFEATKGNMIYYEAPGGRICILFPFMGNIIAGTTDIAVESPNVDCTNGEIKYILKSLSHVFPNIKISEKEIIFHYCGVRPLPKSDSQITGKISRSHQCIESESHDAQAYKIFSLVGGKWTTFRSFSEEVTNKILTELKLKRIVSTENKRIGGGKSFPITEAECIKFLKDLNIETKFSDAKLNLLFERYGTKLKSIIEYILLEDDAPLKSLGTYSIREIKFIMIYENVCHLDDVVIRRTSIAIKGECTKELIREISSIAKIIFGWSDEVTLLEADRCREVLKNKHGVDI